MRFAFELGMCVNGGYKGEFVNYKGHAEQRGA
jgi:hypothetical protein